MGQMDFPIGAPMLRATYVFCHGLNGTGRYDKKYEKKPYWGRASGTSCPT